MSRIAAAIALTCFILVGCGGEELPPEPSPEQTALAFIEAINAQDCAALMDAYHPDLRTGDCSPDSLWLVLAGIANALATELNSGTEFVYSAPPPGFTLGDEIASVDYLCAPTQTCAFITVRFQDNWYVGELE